MGCSCNGSSPATTEYVYTAPDGSTKVYTSQVQAQAATIRFGGTWQARSK